MVRGQLGGGNGETSVFHDETTRTGAGGASATRRHTEIEVRPGGEFRGRLRLRFIKKKMRLYDPLRFRSRQFLQGGWQFQFQAQEVPAGRAVVHGGAEAEVRRRRSEGDVV